MDFATSLTTALERAMDLILEDIAKDGLKILVSLLEEAGFSKSPYLQDYQVYSHIRGDEIWYEIVLDIQSLDMTDDQVQKLTDQSDQTPDEAEPDATFTIPTPAARVYAGARRILGIPKKVRDARKAPNKYHDARVPATDARRDARKNATDRRIDRDVRVPAPRKFRVNPDGKLIIALKKEIEQRENDEIRLPSDDFEGILGKFLDQLTTLIADKFTPELERIIERRIS